ncbi:MAG: hypothetical protein DWQ01_09885 [Planctomycetota bacterium]|nr:MAG: hypothetical protein DWQ01_09885 [Planctomycetota bacterium]
MSKTQVLAKPARQKSSSLELGLGVRIRGLVMSIACASLLLCSGCSNPDAEYEAAFETDEIESFVEVLTKHPEHARAAAATARLGELRWHAASKAPDAETLEALLASHPQANFAEEAELLLDNLTWESATKAGAASPLHAYLERFPRGRHVEAARERLEELAWNEAIASDSGERLEEFLTSYPDTQHRTEAEQRIEDLAWGTAISSGSAEQLTAFAKRFPKTSRKQEIEYRIRELAKQEYVALFENDDVEALKAIDASTLDRDILEAFWWPPLLLAADTDASRIAAYLIENGADVNARGQDESTAMHLAARSGSLEVAKLLLENGGLVDAKVEKRASFIKVGEGGSLTHHTPAPTAKKGTPLHWAAYYNQPGMVAFLVEHGAAVNADDGYQTRPIHFAAQSGNLDLVKALVEAGANWDVEKEEYRSPQASPLHYASTSDVAEYFVADGAKVDMDSDLGQPIHAAAYFGHTEVLGYLLDKGASVDAECSWEVGALNSVKATPVWIAAFAGRPDMIDYLVEKGADLQYSTQRGGSLLHAAAMRGNGRTIEYLLEKGLPVESHTGFPHAHPMVQDWSDITPLGVAVHYRELEAVKALVAGGASVTAKFWGDWDPISLAERDESMQIVAYLREHR